MDQCNQLAATLVARLRVLGLYITTVESCTGGGLVNCITNVSGSSEVLTGSRVTYSNEEKIKLGVPRQVIEEFTVYSMETAVAMAQAGMRAAIRADIGLGITGSLTRTDPNNPNSKIGNVYIAVVVRDQIYRETLCLGAGASERWEAKCEVIAHALQMTLDSLDAMDGSSSA